MSDDVYEYRGGCLCGAVTYRITAPAPRAMFLCHCSRCRKESGTVHCANVFFSEDAELEWLTGRDGWRRFDLPGTRKSCVFCTTCGSPLPRSRHGGGLVLPAGTLDEAPDLMPTAHIYCDSRAPWEDAIGGVPRHDELPT